MARPGHLADCHPFCGHSSAESWPGVGSRDSVEYYNGRLLFRNFLTWEEGRAYLVLVTDARDRGVLEAEFRIEAAPDGTNETIMRVSGRGLPARRLPARLRLLNWKAWERALMERYFDHVIRGFEYHLMTGNKVERSQFGWLPLFS